MISTSNVSLVEFSLWLILGTNVTLWSYILLGHLDSFRKRAEVKQQVEINNEIEQQLCLQAPATPLLLAAPAEKKVFQTEMPEIIEGFNESFELVSYEEVAKTSAIVEEEAPTISGLNIEILEDDCITPPLSVLSMGEIADLFGVRLISSQEWHAPLNVTFFDQLIKNPKDSQSTLILTKLDGKDEKKRFQNLQIEAFYEGVDVVTNFDRSLFMSKDDVLSMIESYSSLYRELILVADRDDAWIFEPGELVHSTDQEIAAI